MTAIGKAGSSPWQRLGLVAAAILAAATIGLTASGVASAQTTGTPPSGTTPSAGQPTTPPAQQPATGALSVDVDVDDDEVDRDEDSNYDITVRNIGAVPVTDATLEVNFDDGFEIQSVTDTGDKTNSASGDRSLQYTLGALQPGQELQFTVHAELQRVSRDDDGDDFDVSAEVQSASVGGGDKDTESVELDLND